MLVCMCVYMLVCMRVYAGVYGCVCWCVWVWYAFVTVQCEGQRTTCRSWLSPSIMGSQGSKTVVLLGHHSGFSPSLCLALNSGSTSG